MKKALLLSLLISGCYYPYNLSPGDSYYDPYPRYTPSDYPSPITYYPTDNPHHRRNRHDRDDRHTPTSNMPHTTPSQPQYNPAPKPTTVSSRPSSTQTPRRQPETSKPSSPSTPSSSGKKDNPSSSPKAPWWNKKTK